MTRIYQISKYTSIKMTTLIFLLLTIVPLSGAAATFANLPLINGWNNSPFSTRPAGVSVVNGIVTFKGAIATTGTNAVPFNLPAAFRPITDVYVPVDLCNAAKGRLYIQPSGVVTVQAKTSFADAQCFTSLEGVSFARLSTSFTTLSLLNGWSNAPFSTSNAVVRNIKGIVNFKGAVAGGTTGLITVLPAGFRPATDVYVPVDLCNAAKGRLYIQPSGNVSVQAEGGTFTNAQCFTSLDGASFATSTNGFTNLTLQNGWTNAPFSTSNAAVEIISGIAHFKGAIATSGVSAVPFTLPAEFRPSTAVYVAVDLCNATNGRLYIQPNGVVTVQAETTFSNAQCFTSLDGASFAVTAFSPLTLQNGWNNAPFSTSNAAVTAINGVVTFRGAIATTGTNAVPFNLPAAFRPITDVYVPVDLCNAAKGRLYIQPSGVVTVQAKTSFADAQCFTSLEGVSFARLSTSFTTLSLLNSWSNAPFSTSNAVVRNIAGIVHFKGAVAGGTTGLITVLPTGFRPATDVYVPVDLCNAAKGRLYIQPSGNVSVQAEGGAFTNAQCFTSLDGASFALSASGYVGLTLVNSWANAPFSTSNAAVKNIGGVLHFKGAVNNGTTALIATLPSYLRPEKDTYIPVDLCNATNGRLYIQPNGNINVQAEGGTFSNAQCFTSLDGAWSGQ